MLGVHSPKFPEEHSTDALRQAVLRLEIEHPVVNDHSLRVWTEYAVRAWPTLMFVDPNGKVIGKHEGEFEYDQFRSLIAQMLQEFDKKGTLRRGPVIFQPLVPPDTPLLFPGKLLVDPTAKRLFVADSGHHRIVVADMEGRVQKVVGAGKGLADGGPEEARFNYPQGMALEGDLLYVADTDNHAIRAISMRDWAVSTVAGTGEQARRVKEGPATSSPLSSPWDLAMHNGILYIAMAGSHHLWSYDPASSQVARYAGSGREALTDERLARATFAQPSGLATDGARLYVADSETSAIRSVDLPGTGDQVQTLVGQGLFVFGDVDGTGEEVLLQHVLGVSWDPSPPPALPPGSGTSHLLLDEAQSPLQSGEATGPAGVLYLADTYNNKIKWLAPRTARVATLAGNGDGALQDGPAAAASFWEPGGLSLAGRRLYVADTNNHAVRVIDLETMEVSTVKMDGL